MARPAEMRPPNLASRHSSERERFESPSLSSARYPYSQAESSGPPDSVVLVRNNPRCWIAGKYSTGATPNPSEIPECGQYPTSLSIESARLSISFPPSCEGPPGVRRRNRTSNFFRTFWIRTFRLCLGRPRQPLEVPSTLERRQKARLSPFPANLFRGASRGRGQSRPQLRGR